MRKGAGQNSGSGKDLDRMPQWRQQAGICACTGGRRKKCPCLLVRGYLARRMRQHCRTWEAVGRRVVAQVCSSAPATMRGACAPLQQVGCSMRSLD